jgi:hypothetical protein
MGTVLAMLLVTQALPHDLADLGGTWLSRVGAAANWRDPLQGQRIRTSHPASPFTPEQDEVWQSAR